ERLELRPVQLTQIAQVSLPQAKLCGSPGSKKWDLDRLCRQAGGHVQAPPKSFHNTLQSPKIPARHDGQPGRFVREQLARSRKINAGDLEQVCVELPMRLVVQANREKARHQALPQPVLALAAGVVDA